MLENDEDPLEVKISRGSHKSINEAESDSDSFRRSLDNEEHEFLIRKRIEDKGTGRYLFFDFWNLPFFF